jgi:hypothetical protein
VRLRASHWDMLALLLALLLAYPTSPNRAVTPGEVRPLSMSALCSTKWGKDARKVTLSMKKHVAAAYGVPWDQHALYEFDHLVPRELGGADSERNLWPQLFKAEYGAHQKDLLENELHRQVCAGALPLATAQDAIRTDWEAAYRRYVKPRLHPRQ